MAGNLLSSSSHGGLLLPLDVFRPTMLAAVLGEALVAKARNILDAKLRITRHERGQLLLCQITGSVVGDDPALFWREHADLAIAATHVVPRQVFLYYATPGPGSDRREGFIVAQRGQVLAADEATADKMPPGATEQDWPLPRLCGQMMIELEELAAGFAGGTHVELSLVDPSGDDQQLLTTLAGAGADDAADGPAEAGPDPAQVLEADAKRRAAEHAAEAAERDRRATEVASGLAFAVDELGVVVAPDAELSETDVLGPLSVSRVHGDLPAGLPTDLTEQLQGKRVDFVVRVGFLSEVLIENTPASRDVLERRATSRDLDGARVEIAEVLAPRLGYGSLVRLNEAQVFVSRKPDQPLPAEFVLGVLRGQ